MINLIENIIAIPVDFLFSLTDFSGKGNNRGKNGKSYLNSSFFGRRSNFTNSDFKLNKKVKNYNSSLFFNNATKIIEVNNRVNNILKKNKSF